MTQHKLILAYCTQREAVVWINREFITAIIVQPHSHQGQEVYHAIVRTVDQSTFLVTEAVYANLVDGFDE